VIFSGKTTLGLIRLKVKVYSQKLDEIFKRIFGKLGAAREKREDEFDNDFFDEADNEIDNLFT
jgi:hypothetical protein